MAKVALNHRTRYLYDKPVSLGPQVIQLRPAPYGRTPILSYSLEVTPPEHVLTWQLDVHHNHLARLLFSGKTREFTVDVNLVAELTPINPFAFILEPGVEEYPFKYDSDLAEDLRPYLATDIAGPFFSAFIAGCSVEKQGSIDFLVDLNRRVRDEVGYVTRLEHGVQSPDQTLEKRAGSCRDSAWLLVQALRHSGIAARFVSGYLIQLATEQDATQNSTGPQTDSADLHAWAEAYLPGAGWIGFDPTSGLFASEGHIPLMCTPTPAKAAPIWGTVEPSGVDFSYTLSIRRLDDTSRSTWPLADEKWTEVRKLALRVDADLQEQDVRLTMGGEPTFVGIDESDSPQWNIEALGPLKRTCGLNLIRSLRDRFASGAMLHYGQGKWYPGEPLPRWALSCFWRADEVPIWENAELFGREDSGCSYESADALRFIEALTRRLQVTAENILHAFNQEERAQPAGYVLPIRRRQREGKLVWSSQLWFARPEHAVLTPGDSSIGFRIPTEILPWVTPDELKYDCEAAPLAYRAKLPRCRSRRMDLFEKVPTPDSLPATSSSKEDVAELIRPSLCVEARAGRLHVFLPYVSQLADYLDLVAAVEDTCAHLNIPIWLEGYTPPSDPRLQSFSVTPDPGVLEVNLPPAGSWSELERIYVVLDEEARRNRLTTEKFNYNGIRIATGGGSHIVVGGRTPSDSPCLRRPDLIRSMVSFWQNHPSLSYLFSGMYVGPTSQYPRVDEARMDALYELEIAFDHLPENDCPPEVIDGSLRNLLVDMTGNSHRAEFCVDKLYPPPGLGLRLGLLELRGFEMPPHVRMGLLQSLLIRALISAFWKNPFAGKLVRWGTALHDRFMLPHFVSRDFSDVLKYLLRAGYEFDEEWFIPQMEFRFPKIGSINADGVNLELRRALEPWNVLGEDTTSGRTVRNVDSSLERIQIKLSGMESISRYAVTCNGRRVPLQPTGKPAAMVAGVRYCARQLSVALHPTISPHVPLVFDLIDLVLERSIARGTYYAGPADGSQYACRPANSTEAEKRRSAHFQASSGPNGSIIIPPDETNVSFPITLDLRVPPPGEKSRFAR
jgi:uncharacterized protein (DUF2126 family)/transglutaminase-like putative cysteine protease